MAGCYYIVSLALATVHLCLLAQRQSKRFGPTTFHHWPNLEVNHFYVGGLYFSTYIIPYSSLFLSLSLSIAVIISDSLILWRCGESSSDGDNVSLSPLGVRTGRSEGEGVAVRMCRGENIPLCRWCYKVCVEFREGMCKIYSRWCGQVPAVVFERF